MSDIFSRIRQSSQAIEVENDAKSNSRTRLKNRLRLVSGLLLITWLITKADWGQLWQHVKQGQSSLVLAATLVFGASRLVEALRLYGLCKGTRITLSDSTRMVFAGMFFHNLSTSLVGDGYKVVYITRTGARLAQAAGIVLLDRLIGLAAIVAAASVLLTCQYEHMTQLFGPFVETDAIITSVAMLTLLALLAVLGLAFLTLVTGHPAKLNERVASLVRVMTNTLFSLGVRRLLVALLLSLVSHVGVALTLTELVNAFGEELGLVDAFMVLCVIFVATYLPISVGSLGVREGITIVGLCACGVSESVATAAALLARAIIYAYALLGGAILLRRGKRAGL